LNDKWCANILFHKNAIATETKEACLEILQQRSHTDTMGTQFIVRSQDNKFALKLRTVLYDGVEMIRLRENDIAIFEFDDPDVVVELVVRKKTRSSSGERSGRGKSSSGESLQVAAAADRDNSDGIANLAVAALNNSAAEEAKKPVTIPRKPTAKQTEVRIFI
jgi:hypothetical protein